MLKNVVCCFSTGLLLFRSHKTFLLVLWDEWLEELEFAGELRTGRRTGVSSGKNPKAFLFSCAVGILHVFCQVPD